MSQANQQTMTAEQVRAMLGLSQFKLRQLAEQIGITEDRKYFSIEEIEELTDAYTSPQASQTNETGAEEDGPSYAQSTHELAETQATLAGGFIAQIGKQAKAAIAQQTAVRDRAVDTVSDAIADVWGEFPALVMLKTKEKLAETLGEQGSTIPLAQLLSESLNLKETTHRSPLLAEAAREANQRALTGV